MMFCTFIADSKHTLFVVLYAQWLIKRGGVKRLGDMAERGGGAHLVFDFVTYIK